MCLTEDLNDCQIKEATFSDYQMTAGGEEQEAEEKGGYLVFCLVILAVGIVQKTRVAQT